MKRTVDAKLYEDTLEYWAKDRARIKALKAALRDVLYCNTDLMRCGRCRETARAALAEPPAHGEGGGR